MLYQSDIYVSQERYKDMRRDADHFKYVKRAERELGIAKRPHVLSRAIAWLGRVFPVRGLPARRPVPAAGRAVAPRRASPATHSLS